MFIRAGLRHMRFSQGFTLIEILVVMLIVSLGASLVGPRLFGVYEKIQASVEEQKLVDLLAMVKMRAFLRQTPYSIETDRNILKIKDEKAGVVFSWITFPNAGVTFNGNGFPDANSITYFIRGKKKVINALQ